jgi:hypothetical protein
MLIEAFIRHCLAFILAAFIPAFGGFVMMNKLFISTVLLMFSASGALTNASNMAQGPGARAAGSSSQERQNRREERSSWVWKHSDDGGLVEARVEGKVVFADDYTDILSVNEDGLFQATDERSGEARKLRVTQGADGGLQRSYYVNGRRQEFDAEGKAWLSKFLMKAVREGGLDAKARARRIFQQRGARGVLDEISLMENDYGRRIYFGTLIKEGNLDAATLKSALRQAARQLTSDYERATFLIESADRFLAHEELIAVFFETTKKIDSAYEHHRVLKSVLEKQPDRRVLGPMLASASAIGSDYEKAGFLIEAASFYLADRDLRAAFLQTVNAIDSDYERGRVLSVVSKRMQLGSTLD